MEGWPWGEPCKKLSSSWVIREITAHMCTGHMLQFIKALATYYFLWGWGPRGFDDLWCLIICKRIDNFLFSRISWFARKRCGGLTTVEFLTSSRGVTWECQYLGCRECSELLERNRPQDQAGGVKCGGAGTFADTGSTRNAARSRCRWGTLTRASKSLQSWRA